MPGRETIGKSKLEASFPSVLKSSRSFVEIINREEIIVIKMCMLLGAFEEKEGLWEPSLQSLSDGRVSLWKMGGTDHLGKITQLQSIINICININS